MDNLVGYVNAVFIVFFILVLVRMLLSWVPNPPYTGIGRTLWDFVHQSTEWYLRPFRKLIPPIGMIDVSGIVAIVVLMVANNVVVRVLDSVVN
ncbi:MAG: YggT family protein [Thermoleophilia bacterium]|nr:YggT family protein [Thermoleophilia bacterium]